MLTDYPRIRYKEWLIFTFDHLSSRKNPSNLPFGAGKENKSNTRTNAFDHSEEVKA